MSIGGCICCVQCEHYAFTWTEPRTVGEVTSSLCLGRRTTWRGQSQNSGFLTGLWGPLLWRIVLRACNHQRGYVHIPPGVWPLHGPFLEGSPFRTFVLQQAGPPLTPSPGSTGLMLRLPQWPIQCLVWLSLSEAHFGTVGPQVTSAKQSRSQDIPM